MIDMHAHYYGEALFAGLARRRAVPMVERQGDTRYMVTPTSRFALAGGFLSLADRLGFMDAQGIATQLLTFPGALGPDVLPVAEAAPLVAAVNDEMAQACRDHPGRFAALAGLPLADVAAAVAELRRAMRQPGCIGAILPTGYFESLAHADYLAPVIEAGDALGAHFMLHPGPRHDQDMTPVAYADLGVHRASTLDLQNAISHAFVTLMYAGFAARFPGCSFQVVNLGGALPFVIERMDHVIETRDSDAARPSTLFGRIVVDAASMGPRALEAAVAVLGADRVMMGTDYPIFATAGAGHALAAARLTDAERQQVATSTARAILDRRR